MRILIDEDVDVRVLRWLQDQGHEAVRVPTGLKNGRVLALAIQEKRILISRDKDFTNRLQYPPANYPGLVVLRIHPPHFERLISALKRCFDQLPDDQIRAHLIVVQEAGFHILG